MRELEPYLGSIVRDYNGQTGRLLGSDESSVKIGWIERDSVLPRVESINKDADRARFGFDVLVLNTGWVNISNIYSKPSVHAVVESLIEGLDDQNPFVNSSRIGPGPAGEYRRRMNRWSCSGSNYVYKCVGIAPETKGQTKILKVNPEKKAMYNRRFKKFIARGEK